MKPILRTRKKSSRSLKLASALIFFVAILSFVISLKFSGKNKSEQINLIKDDLIPCPEVSEKGGFHSSPFSFELKAPKEYEIRYTTDGSEPGSTSEIYGGPVFVADQTGSSGNLSAIPSSPRWKPPLGDVFKGTVLRAICVKDGVRKGKELVRTFFIRRNNYSLPVVALTIDQDDFFGYKKGIYVLGKNYEDKRDYIRKGLRLDLSWWEYPSNYLKRGENSERPLHIEFYEPDGSLGFESNAGVRINGNATRGFSQKSLRICFDPRYGTSPLNYKLFPASKVNEFNSFILRNSGNDWNKTMFRDALMQSLMEGSAVDIQAYRPSIVLINGEYWGIHNIRERSDENYLSNKYKINKDSLAILEYGGELSFGKRSDKEDFKELLNFIVSNDLSTDHNYQYVERRIDINSFMDFIIANVYFCNADWPNNNVKYWHYRAAGLPSDSSYAKDGRWRWVLYDTDWGFGYTDKNAVQLDLLLKAEKTGSIGIIFKGLLKNRKFVQRFSERFNYHLENTFDQVRVVSKINLLKEQISPEMNEHINRWREIGSFEQWTLNVNELIDFANARPDTQKMQLNSFLKKVR